MYGNLQLNLSQQINKLNYVTQTNDTSYLLSVINETDRLFCLYDIVVAELITTNSGIRLDKNVTPTYENHVALAKRYIEILRDELSYLQSTLWAQAPFSQRAINALYNNQGFFAMDNVIHRKNGKILTVANVLSVIGYAKNVIETLGVKIDGKYSMALMVINTIELALNNRRQDKPLNKALHLTNDVLAEVAKKVADGERAGQVVSGTSLLFDITIDFFVKE